MNSQQYQIDKINKDQKDNYSILQKKIDDEKLEIICRKVLRMCMLIFGQRI